MTSTVAVGRAFEQHAMRFLNHHLNMCVRHVGGAGDEGIDLRGFWYVPSGAVRTTPLERRRTVGGTKGEMIYWDNPNTQTKNQPLSGYGMKVDQTQLKNPILEVEDWEQGGELRKLRVLAQCKAENKPLSSRPIREMEGVIAHFHGRDVTAGPHQYDKTGAKVDRIPPPTVGIVISRTGFSQIATVRAWRSPSPLILVHLPGGSAINPNERDDGVGEEGQGMKVTGCWWNPALSGLKGLLGGTMEIRREILPENVAIGGIAGPKEQWRVWYKGKRLGRVGPTVEEGLRSRH